MAVWAFTLTLPVPLTLTLTLTHLEGGGLEALRSEWVKRLGQLEGGDGTEGPHRHVVGLCVNIMLSVTPGIMLYWCHEL